MMTKASESVFGMYGGSFYIQEDWSDWNEKWIDINDLWEYDMGRDYKTNAEYPQNFP